MPDDQYTDEDLAGYGSPPAVAPPAAPPPATFGYMYGSSRYANEPPVPRPTQAQLEALPANTLTDIPTGGWAYRETVPHQERLMQLDREAQRARQAAEAAAQDAQMFAQMSRVARSVKDIEIARRSIDVMGLQRDIQNGVPIHDAVTRHPLALGSGYGSALQHTAPAIAPTVVAPSGSTPGYIQDPRGVPHFFPGSGQPTDHKLGDVIQVNDPVTGEHIANLIVKGPRTGQVEKLPGIELSASNQIQIQRLKLSVLQAQLNSDYQIPDKATREKAISEHTAELAQVSKDAGAIQNQIKIPKKFETAPPVSTNKLAGRVVRDPKTGKLKIER